MWKSPFLSQLGMGIVKRSSCVRVFDASRSNALWSSARHGACRSQNTSGCAIYRHIIKKRLGKQVKAELPRPPFQKWPSSMCHGFTAHANVEQYLGISYENRELRVFLITRDVMFRSLFKQKIAGWCQRRPALNFARPQLKFTGCKMRISFTIYTLNVAHVALKL